MSNLYISFSFEMPFPKDTNSDIISKYLDNLDSAVSFEILESDNVVWVFSEENGDPDDAAIFVQNYLNHFDIDGGIYFSWSETCSKLHVDQFAGGGCLVTKDEIHSSLPSDVIDNHKDISLLNN